MTSSRATQELHSSTRAKSSDEVVSPYRADGTHFSNFPSRKILLENGNRLALLLAVAVVSYFAVLQISKWPDRLRYPGEEDGAEGTQLSEMVHLRRGVHIYRNPSGGDFDSAIYGPFSYLLGAAVVNPDKPAYLPLRLLSLIAALGLIVASYVFVTRLTGKPLAGCLAALLLLGGIFIGRYGVSARADMVALLLSFVGFLVFYRYRNSKRALVVSAVLILLSFFYKQQFVGAPAAIFLYLMISKHFRQAAAFAAILAAGGLLLVAALSFLVFPQQSFLLHFLGYNRLPFNKELLVPEILMFVIPLFVPLLASADFLDRHPDKLLACYAGMASVSYFLLLFSSGSGADTNRCLEPALILSCLLAARIATAEGWIGGLAWTGATALTLGLVTLLGSAFVVRRISPDDFAADRALQNYLRENFPPGTDVLGYYPADPLRAGLNAPITNLWHYSALIRKGALSDRDIVARIDRGGYGAILLDFDLTNANPTKADFYTTQSMREAMTRSYVQSARLKMPAPEFTRFTDGNIYAWVPRASRDARGSQ